MIKNILSLLFIVSFTPVTSKAPYSILTGDYQEIVSGHFEYVEGLDSNVALDDLLSVTWSKELATKQAYIDGFWMKVSLVNNSDQLSFFLWSPGGVFSVTKSSLYLVRGDQIISSNSWSFGDKLVDENRWLYSYKVTLSPGDLYTLYYYVQARPYAHRQDTIEVLSIMTWEDSYNFLIFDLVINWTLVVVLSVFGIYYLVIFLGSRETIYALASLCVLSISIHTLLISQMGNYIPMQFILSDFRFLVLVCFNIAFPIFSIHFLDIRTNSRKIYRVFLVYFGVMAAVFVGFLVAFIRWPLESNLDLVKHPPNISSLLYARTLALPLLVGTGLSCYVAFILWRKGNKAAGKFLLTFVPVVIISLFYLFGRVLFSDVVINVSVQLLTLLCLILFGFAVSERINELKQETVKKQVLLTESYQRFVPEQLLTNLEKESILDVYLGDQVEKDMTVLFSDIRSFTTISESMSPNENFQFINSYLEMMGPLVRNNGGYIDKYIGDAIMALFDEDPSRAVATAVDMLDVLRRYNQEQNRQGDDCIRIGIGINTGRLILGTVGESNRMEGSVISDAVNVAARLEGLTKVYGTPLLISDGTTSMLDPNQWLIRSIDQVAVKGKNEGIMIYEVLDGEEPHIKDGKLSTMDTFNQGIEYYQTQQFGKAKVEFETCKNKFGQDAVVQVYIRRCDQLIAGHIDLSNWDGVNRLDVK